MLDSVIPITDLIVAVDTGSIDDTINKIYQFGKENNIPAYVFDRPFDNFCNSRNYALKKLIEVVHQLNWNLDSTWGFTLDCDEVMNFSSTFSKEDITLDFHNVIVIDEKIQFKRNLLFRLSKDFIWEGPIHEFIKYDFNSASQSVIRDIIVTHGHDGSSWKGDLESKFLNYANHLQKHIEEGHRDIRWSFYIGESYSAAAHQCKHRERKRELLLMALKKYEETISQKIESRDERYLLYSSIADTKSLLNYGEEEVRYAFLKAYSMDKRHAEPFKKIIEIYLKNDQWQIAYIYSLFATSIYHGEAPKENDISKLEAAIYQWKLMYYHAIICLHTYRTKECLHSLSKIKEVVKEHPEYFNSRTIVSINSMLLQANFLLAKYFVYSFLKNCLTLFRVCL